MAARRRGLRTGEHRLRPLASAGAGAPQPLSFNLLPQDWRLRINIFEIRAEADGPAVAFVVRGGERQRDGEAALSGDLK